MPIRPKPTCIAVGCPERTEGGRFCTKHADEHARNYHRDSGAQQDRERGSSWDRGYDTRHRNWRKLVLARDPVCVKCQRLPSIIADHVKPLAEGGGWELENGQGLCIACHNAKTVSENLSSYGSKRTST